MSPVYVEVCSACKRAACFQGVFFCEEYRSAGTRLIDVKVLERLDLEHPDYWQPARERP